ncbi:plant calmodulin-binding protein-like protein [Actinidia rufa]|uniref:Plant calmodulin-binding protein-like protein n=1 Tax=Actinidia rufa TaxID=165716 RepID=A0A7J0H1T9_9ERIC|nr:plant calmodulin-binding protein-like protein [Actinidia rufa]
MAETIDITEHPEKIVIEGDHTRRNSTGNLRISKRMKVLPRYLSDSARNPIPKRITERPGKDQDQAEDAILQAKKKKSVISPKPLADSKSKTTKEHNPAKKKHSVIRGPKTLQTKPSSFSTLGHLSSKRYSEIIPHKAVGDVQVSPSGASSSRRQSDISTSKEMKGSRVGKKSNMLRRSASPSHKPSTKRESIAKSEYRKGPKQASHMISQGSNCKAESKQPVLENVPEKTLYVIETKPEDPTVGLAQNGNGAGHSSQNPSQSPPSTKSRRLRHARNGTPISRSFSSSSLSLRKENFEMHQDRDDGSDPIAEGSETKSEKQIAHPKVDHTSRPRCVGKVISADKVGSPRKLHFTRGKLIEIQATNESPRRLRFKKRTVFGENQNGKADTEARKLEQDVEGKKGGQSLLLNNVIEETASKLEQTRKSKVKALVGAFETLISLQDTKSSAAKGT